MNHRLFVLGSVLALAGCNAEDPLMRMYEQKKAKAQAANKFFPDGKVNQTPPKGTVPRERNLDLLERAPTMDLALLKQGKHRYEIVCATCHGYTGEANSLVGSNMALRPPPSLHDQRDKTDAHIFEVIGNGYGLMPSFPEIPLKERWAIVGYVRALQVSQRASLEAAPAEVQAKLMAEPTGGSKEVPKEEL